MAYRVKLARRARRDLSDLYATINARTSEAVRVWYRGLSEELRGLGRYPKRCEVIPEDPRYRHLLYGNKPHVYRVIYRTVDSEKSVEVLHLRHGARAGFVDSDLQ